MIFLFVCVVIMMRKNPPSPLHKVKRKSTGHDKFSEFSSPSPLHSSFK